jgi:16S rRNA processing protein RimM
MASTNLRHPEEAAQRPSRRTHGADPTAGTRRICLGVVTGPQGVQGAVRIKPFTEVPENVARYGPVEDEAGERRFELRLIGTAKGVVIVRVSGVESRDQAETLRGLRLYLPRAALPETEPDEYYHADLIGLEAVLEDGTPVGRVRAIHDFGAGDTLELVRTSAPPVMVPFTRAVVPHVELAQRRLVLDPPPGLLDDREP